MLNQFVCVGRVVDQPKKITTKDGLILSLAILRNYKNAEGVYETDFIDVIVKGDIANQCAEYIHKGDIVGVKGHLETDNSVIGVIAEKVTFLSDKKSEESEDEE